MGEFIVGIVMDVLIHVFVQNRKSGSVGRISSSTWNFFVWDAAEFVVLHPEVGLQNFRSCRESKQGGIASRDMPATFRLRQKGRTVGQEPDAGCRGTRGG